PEFPLGDGAFAFPAADLFVERVEQLLAGGRTGEGRALVERAAEAAAVEAAFGRAIERHAEAIKQVDDLGAPVAHFLDGRLVIEEVAAVDRVVKMLVFVVALRAGDLVDAVDAALRAD